MVVVRVVGVVVWVVVVVVLGRFGKTNGQGCSGIGFDRCGSGKSSRCCGMGSGGGGIGYV